MGSPESEKRRSNNETQHKVTLTKGFWMAETEVTQEMWQAVMGDNPSYFQGTRAGGVSPLKLPVEKVSWDDCQTFVKKFNEKINEAGAKVPASLNGFVASLPTEAQWEYACRAGTNTPYGSGKSLNDIWYFSNSVDKTHPVGTKTANVWGLYDMHGNVWEWCSDLYGDYNGDATDPTGAATGAYRVNRGGAWNSAETRCRSAYRSSDSPGNRNGSLGFRLSFVSEDTIVLAEKAASAESGGTSSAADNADTK
jgi:formylglycine-generating enzyme required for sulfatase activity